MMSTFIATGIAVIFHTMNTEGAAKMENHLNEVSRVTDRIPFKLIVLGKVDIKARVLELMEE